VFCWLIFGWKQYDNPGALLTDGVQADFVQSEIHKWDVLSDEDVIIAIITSHLALRVGHDQFPDLEFLGRDLLFALVAGDRVDQSVGSVANDAGIVGHVFCAIGQQQWPITQPGVDNTVVFLTAGEMGQGRFELGGAFFASCGHVFSLFELSRFRLS
jgi:hypothetical protein